MHRGAEGGGGGGGGQRRSLFECKIESALFKRSARLLLRVSCTHVSPYV